MLSLTKLSGSFQADLNIAELIIGNRDFVSPRDKAMGSKIG